jgi:5'-nucleotidase
MAEAPGEAALARILVSNDDGIEAPGIKVLERIARTLSPDVWVVAPEVEQSGAAHSLTTRRPLRMWQVSEQRYVVDGTPTDCVLLALKRLLRDRPPTLVLSGVNAGSNVAEDLTYSGTVAAAMEAALFGLPAIALSQDYRDRSDIPWATAEACAAEVIRRLVKQKWPAENLFNVNFPAVPAAAVRGFAVTHQGKRKVGDNLTEVRDPRGRQYYWIGSGQTDGDVDPGSDVAALVDGKVSITPICLDLTNAALVATLQGAFG